MVMDAENFDGVWSGCRRWIGRVLAVAPIFLAAGVGVVIWEIFRPGFLDLDGVGQLQMAVDNHYNDWFSPLLPLGCTGR